MRNRDPRYRALLDVFADVLERDPASGAALAVSVAGDLVVDLWGGTADPRSGRPWGPDTLALTFSCSKGLVTSCVLMAAQDGQLELDAPVSDYWPAFGAAGKQDITVRMVLGHTAGVAALDTDLTLDDVLEGGPAVRAIEAQRPQWEPGTQHAYHAMTWGLILSELLRRTGRPLDEHFGRLTDFPGADTWLRADRADVDRVAPAAWDPARSDLDFPPDSPATPWRQRTMTRAITLGGAFEPGLVAPSSGLNDPVLQAAGIPGVGVVSTARSLAEVWARTIGSAPLLDPDTVRDATRCVADGPTALGTPPPHARWASGYMLRSGLAPMLGPGSFGHDGAGGQLCFADPDADVGFAFLTNNLRNRDDTRAADLVAALRDCL